MASRISEEKQNKFFRKWDILIYAILALLIVALFLIVFLPTRKSQYTGFRMEYDGKVVLEYDFDKDSMQLDKNYVSYAKESATTYTIWFKNGEDENIIIVDIENRVITCEEANCSLSKDCTHMKISKMGDTIICIPHKLMISPIGKGEIPDPVVG